MTTRNEFSLIDEDQHIDKIEMHNTLSFIAHKLEQFHCNAVTKNEIKTKLNILTSPKNKENSLNAQNSEKCLQTDDDYNNLITENNELKRENEILSKIINISFQKLKTIRGETLDDHTTVDTLEQLKQLVVCCGQYYADYCNECIKNTQLQQRNSFLYNKTIILKTNVLGLNEELKNIKYQNTRLKIELLQLRRVKRPQKRYKFTFDEKVIHDVDLTGDVESHVKLVKKLLLEQDYALKELDDVKKNEEH